MAAKRSMISASSDIDFIDSPQYIQETEMGRPWPSHVSCTFVIDGVSTVSVMVRDSFMVFPPAATRASDARTSNLPATPSDGSPVIVVGENVIPSDRIFVAIVTDTTEIEPSAVEAETSFVLLSVLFHPLARGTVGPWKDLGFKCQEASFALHPHGPSFLRVQGLRRKTRRAPPSANHCLYARPHTTQREKHSPRILHSPAVPPCHITHSKQISRECQEKKELTQVGREYKKVGMATRLTLGARKLRRYRKVHHLTQAQLGSVLGISCYHVSKFECGYRIPDRRSSWAIRELTDGFVDLPDWDKEMR